jgi:iron-sulfur cluster assembly protein
MESATKPAVLTVTPIAAAKLKEILAREKRDPAIEGMRIGVQGGGCSGMSYVMDLDAPAEGDLIFEKDGVRVMVDPKSMEFLKGTTLDYKEGLMTSGFSITNPNEKGRCGCGESCSV